ncbi:DUF3363 domain-containing protein [Hellea sp.]|nr:DUF3363 domain-containing protein [Hellea sp.]
MAGRGEDQFEVYLGRLRSSSGSRRAVGFFETVSRGAKSKRGRGRSGGSSKSSGQSMRFYRRVVVKASIKKMAGHGLSSFRKHLDYIQRDGTDEKGERAKLYGDGLEDVELQMEGEPNHRAEPLKQFAERCKDDRHHFRFIVAPEDSAKLQNLTEFTRDLVQKMESDLGTKLDWVAANHHDTGQPHSHLIVRGVRDTGDDLVIPRKYISQTMRQRAQELVDIELGPVSQIEGRVRLAHTIDMQRYTELDRSLSSELKDGIVDMSKPVPKRRVWHRQLQVRRLQSLSTMGLASRAGSGRWTLDPNFRETLREMGARGNIIKAIHQSMSEDGYAPGLMTERNRYDPNRATSQDVTGVVRKFGRPDETQSGGFVVIRSLKGELVYTRVREDEIFETLRKDQVVTLQPHPQGARKIDHSIADFAKTQKNVYSEVYHVTEARGVSPAYAQAHVRRLEALCRKNLVSRNQDGSWRIPDDYLKRAANYEALRAARLPTPFSRDSIQTLSEMERARGATWLDKRLVRFGAEGIGGTSLGESLLKRQSELRKMGFALDKAGRFPPSTLEALREIDLQDASGHFQKSIGKPYAPLGEDRNVEGIYKQSIQRPSGKFAVVERAKDFTLVPWRPVMERRIGQTISGKVSAGGISWDIAKARGMSR